MQNLERIDKFTAVMNYIWRTKCPEWSFGQFMANSFGGVPGAILFTEDDTAIDILCTAFDMTIEDVLAEIHWEDGDETSSV